MIVVDISSNNPHPIDWAAVKAAGVSGVYVKATEGAAYISPDFGADYRAAKAAGLRAGAYHFWEPGQPVGAQLNWFHSHYGPALGDLPPAWDAEINPTNRSWADLASDLATVAWDLVTWYGDAAFYYNRSWRAALVPHGLPYNRPEWVAQGSAGPVQGAWLMQFPPAAIPGIGGQTDWSAG